MSDKNLIGAGLIVALGGKELTLNLLGPTSAYLGEELRNFTQRGVEKIKTVLEKAAEKLGPRIEGPGGVPPNSLLKNSVMESGVGR